MTGHQTCERCGEPTLAITGSMFNTELICMRCQDLEQAHPSYARAVKTENEQVARGNFNFGGIGLPFDLGGPDDDQTTTRPATCPRCGRDDCKVSESFLQATRSEPMKSLGYSGFCPTCDCSFKVER